MSAQKESAPTLNALLDERVAQDGQATALIHGERRVSFVELADDVRRAAAGLAALGVGRGDRVAIWLPNGPAWVVLEFALARLGAIAVAINTKFRRHELEDILQRSGAKLLVLQPRLDGVDYLGLVEQMDPTVRAAVEGFVLMDGAGASEINGRPAHAYEHLFEQGVQERDEGAPELPCNVFTSSGTTSAPKLVLHRQSAITHHARAVADRFGYRAGADTVVLGMLPFCGVFGFNTVMGGLAAGRPVVLMSAFDAVGAVELIERHRVTHSSGADEMFRRIFVAAEPVSRIVSLREGAFANFSADAVALIERAQQLDIKLFQTFGSSEVQALMAYAPAGSGPRRWALGGGTPSSDETRVRVRDTESGELLPDGEAGELEIAGPNVMVEYMNNPEANARAITADGFIRTGDLGYMEGPDSFVYLARLGDTLRLGGFLVNPREIEAYLEGIDTIALAQVVAVTTERGPRPVAFVVPRDGAAIDEPGIIARCQATMAQFKVPIRIVPVDAFPTTRSANGEKIQKTKLRDQAQALIDTEAESS